jgi:hypothetical protein
MGNTYLPTSFMPATNGLESVIWGGVGTQMAQQPKTKEEESPKKK